jgi:hypothetical protein
MVRLSEEIKSVVSSAYRLNLTGINAMLLAQRAGDSARGFGVLSMQLREFTLGLMECMGQLRLLIDGAIQAASDSARHRRLLSMLKRSSAVDEQSARLMEPALTAAQQALALKEQRIAERQRALHFAVDEAKGMRMMGSMLARNAKIEAAYGGEFRQEMDAVSQEFERAVTGIAAGLQALGKLQGGGSQ